MHSHSCSESHHLCLSWLASRAFHLFLLASRPQHPRLLVQFLKKPHPQLFLRLWSHCSFGWGPSRLMGNAAFPLAAFPDSSGGINRHLCSHCTCKHFRASSATHLLRLFYLSCFPTVVLKCPDNGDYLIHLKFCSAHSRHTMHACYVE